MISRRAVLLGAGAALLGSKALAQTAKKTLRIVVPFPAGGGTDVLARIVAEKLKDNYAPAAAIANQAGALGTIWIHAHYHARTWRYTTPFATQFATSAASVSRYNRC